MSDETVEDINAALFGDDSGGSGSGSGSSSLDLTGFWGLAGTGVSSYFGSQAAKDRAKADQKAAASAKAQAAADRKTFVTLGIGAAVLLVVIVIASMFSRK